MTTRIPVYHYLHGNASKKTFIMYVAINLPKGFNAKFSDPDMKTGSYQERESNTGKKKYCRICEVEVYIDEKSDGKIFIATKEFKETESRATHIWVKTSGIDGVIFGDPDEGGVGDYDDPDGKE